MTRLAALAFLCLPLMLHAQEKKPGDEMIYKYLCAEADKLSQKFLDGATTIDEWQAKRPRLYQEYMDMLGLWPLPERTPLKATKTGVIEAHGVVVEKLHFQSKPGLYVTANLYRPKDTQRAPSLGFPAVLYVCGHSNRGRDGNKTAFQDHGFWFANNGYVCLIVDTLQMGELHGVHHGTYGRPWISIKKYEDGKRVLPRDVPENRFWWHSIGYSPAAVECWNGIRAIDYLQTLPYVDANKIGVTGISGGGAATFWIAAADPRVKVAVPVSGMADLECYIKDKVINGHCDCMFLYNTYQWDWTTIAALVAPRPLLFANSDKDPIFPMDANRRVMAKLRKLYAMYDSSPKAQGRPSLGLDEYVSQGGHDYRPDLRIAIFRFLNKHLKGDPKSKVEDSAQYELLAGRKLRVFPEDTDIPKDAINVRIDETFIPQAKVTLPEKGKFEEWKKGMIAKLREKSFRGHANRATRPVEMGAQAGLPGMGPQGFSFYTDTSIEVWFAWWGKLKEPADYSNVILHTDGFPDGTPKWAIPIVGQERVMHFMTRKDWTTKSPPNYVERSHLLLGRTVDDGKLWDARCACWTDDDRKRTRIIGKGYAGILAAYAALLDGTYKEIVVIDPPKSHKEGPHFLNVLRVLDIPEALGLLAPTPLTIIGGQDAAFDRTAEIYRLAGAADKLTRK